MFRVCCGEAPFFFGSFEFLRFEIVTFFRLTYLGIFETFYIMILSRSLVSDVQRGLQFSAFECELILKAVQEGRIIGCCLTDM